MKTFARPIIAALAILLIFMSVRRWMNGDSLDYVSLILAGITLVLAFVIMRKDDELGGSGE